MSYLAVYNFSMFMFQCAKFVRTTTIKLFADYELRRKHLEQRDAMERWVITENYHG